MIGPAPGWPEGYWRLVLAETDSTNAEAARRAQAGEATPLWIMAESQTGARGRRGRAWTTGTDNLAASLVLRPSYGPETGALMSFVAGLAVADVIAGLVPDAEIALKWPNDVLVNGAKASGILLESASGGDGRLAWLVIGIGINLSEHRPTQGIRAGGTRPTSLAAEGARPITAADALTRLAACFHPWRARFEAAGFGPIRSAWLARAARFGGPIAAVLDGETVAGRFEDVDETGALVLNTATGRRALQAADIHFPEGV